MTPIYEKLCTCLAFNQQINPLDKIQMYTPGSSLPAKALIDNHCAAWKIAYGHIETIREAYLTPASPTIPMAMPADRPARPQARPDER